MSATKKFNSDDAFVLEMVGIRSHYNYYTSNIQATVSNYCVYVACNNNNNMQV